MYDSYWEYLMSTYTVIGISGSLRKASTNSGLLRCARELAPAKLNIEIADISEIPLFNADVEAAGRPAAVLRLAEQMEKADALLLACPEYNYCMAPPLKNALDWVSRIPNSTALNGKPAAIMGAGGGMGTARAQYQLRQMCVYLNLIPLNKPEFFSNAFSNVFDANGNVVDLETRKQVAALLDSLVAWIERL